LLNELEITPIEENVDIQNSSKGNGILDKIVEKLSSPIPDEIELPIPSIPTKNIFKKEPFSIQIGAYGKKENASLQTKQLGAAGFTTRLELKESNGRTLYVVKIGYYSDRVMAKAAAKELKSTLDIDSIIVENK